MIDDIKKSVNSILYERTTSPLYGTFIVSWIIWNWKIVYLTLFISAEKLNINKIDYILSNFWDPHYLITYPLISTIIFLTVVPFMSNAAYWLALRFNKWKKDQKNQINLKQLLTLEQSMELREQILVQQEKFEKLLENKNLEIKQLTLMIENVEHRPAPIESVNQNSIKQEDELTKLAERIKNNPSELKEYESMLHYIQNGYKLNINSKFIALLESHDIIQTKGNGIYQFTQIGKKFHKLIYL